MKTERLAHSRKRRERAAANGLQWPRSLIRQLSAAGEPSTSNLQTPFPGAFLPARPRTKYHFGGPPSPPLGDSADRELSLETGKVPAIEF